MRVERSLPSDLQAERAILGSALLDSKSLAVAGGFVTGADFFSEANGRIFEALIALRERGEGMDNITLTAELDRYNALQRVGGRAYISSLIDGIPNGINVPHYAGIVRDHSLRRQVIRVANAGITRANDLATEADESIAELLEDLRAALGRCGTPGGELYGLSLLRSCARRGGGVDLGFPRLNDCLGGALAPGEVLTIGAKPGVGKTTIALNIAERILLADAEAQIAFFSLEMPSAQLTRRLMQSFCRVDRDTVDGIANDTISAGVAKPFRPVAEFDRLMRRLLLFDRPTTMRQIEATVAALDPAPAIVIVDYLTKINVPGARFGYERTSAAVEGVKNLAKANDVPVLLLSQLSRGEVRNRETVPTLSSFRDSGRIEEECDHIVGLYEPGAEGNDNDRRRVVELGAVVLKAKHSYRASITYEMDKEFQGVTEMPR